MNYVAPSALKRFEREERKARAELRAGRTAAMAEKPIRDRIRAGLAAGTYGEDYARLLYGWDCPLTKFYLGKHDAWAWHRRRLVAAQAAKVVAHGGNYSLNACKRVQASGRLAADAKLPDC